MKILIAIITIILLFGIWVGVPAKVAGDDSAATVEVNSGNPISLIQHWDHSDIPLTIRNIPDSGLGVFTFELNWNKDVIQVDSIIAGTIDGFFILPGIPDNATGTMTITGFSMGTEYPTGDVTVATMNISAVGNPGDDASIGVTITTLNDQDDAPIPATPVDAPVQIINLMAETGISQTKDADGIIVVSVNITRTKDPTTGLTMEIPDGIGSFTASATVTPASGIQSLDIRGESPFDSPTFDPATGIFGVTSVASPIQADNTTVAKLVSTLSGECTTPYTLTITFQEIGAAADPDVSALEEHSNSLTFLRGDANNNGVVDISDAMNIAQYLVNKKTLEQINALNAASVKHDTGGDEIDISDAMYIAQYIVKQRDAYFNLMG